MSSHEGRPSKPLRKTVSQAIEALIRTRLTAGLLTVLPIIITFWIAKVVFIWMRDASLWVFEGYLLSPLGRPTLEAWHVTPEQLDTLGLAALPNSIQWALSILSVILTICLLYMIGLASANYLGRRLLMVFDSVVGRVPLVKPIYRTLKQVFELFGPQQEAQKQFQRVALVPFPNELTRSVAFITAIRVDELTGEELVAAFIPTTPNPTTGFVFLVKRRDILEVDWTVEMAFKIIMSGGILLPDYVQFNGFNRGGPRAPLGPSPVPGATISPVPPPSSE